jgi:hypothetical protein
MCSCKESGAMSKIQKKRRLVRIEIAMTSLVFQLIKGAKRKVPKADGPQSIV